MVENKLEAYVPTHYKDIKDVQYPCVVKSVSGSFGKGLRIVYSFDELGDIKDNELLNEYVQGKIEYATHVVCKNGEIINHVSMIYHFDDRYYIAGPAKRKDIKVFRCNDEILNLFSGILKKVNYSGFCCIDYKIIGGKPIIFEINARMGYFLTQNPSELKKMIGTYIDECVEVQSVSINDYRKEEIQSLMVLLSKVNNDYVFISNKILCSDLYNPHTKTLSVEKFDCADPSISDLDFDALHIVQHVAGNIDLSNNTSLTRLDGLDNIQTVIGKLIIRGTGITTINGLNKVQEIGSLTVSDNPHLHSINGFTGLRTIRDSLFIQNNEKLLDIHGINSLRQISKGDLVISNNTGLREINGLKRVQVIGRSLILENSANLTDIQFLSSLKTVNNILVDHLKITSAGPLKNVFRGTSHFKGYIKFLHCPLSDVKFMQGMRSVGSSLYLHNNQLSDLSGLEKLERVGASLSLLNNRLSDISQLSHLKETGGMLGLADNQLKSLHGLESLKHIKTVRWNGKYCSLNVSDNPQLKDIGALSNIKENGNNIILLMNDSQHFTRIPESDSIFSQNTIQVFNPDFSRNPDGWPG